MGKSITDTTIIITDSRTIKEGPTLPRNVAGHCMVHIEDRYFMIIGGFDTPYKMASPGAFYINYITGDYLDLPNMYLGRANHACLKWISPEGELMVIFSCRRSKRQLWKPLFFMFESFTL